jgi:hypothetical protein
MNQYLLHLPDVTEYGPVDRATLETWSREGRLPAQTLVWPEGAPEWMPVGEALAVSAVSPALATVSVASPTGAPATVSVAAATVSMAPAAVASPPPAPASARAARPARPAAPAPAADDRPDTRPSMRMPAFDGKVPASSAGESSRSLVEVLAGSRNLLLGLVGIAVVVGLLAGLWAVLRPQIAKRRAIAAVQRHALADRRVEEPQAGLVVELPAGWVALREDNPFVSRPGARLRLAQPAAGTFGTVAVAVRPRQMDDLDAHLD